MARRIVQIDDSPIDLNSLSGYQTNKGFPISREQTQNRVISIILYVFPAAVLTIFTDRGFDFFLELGGQGGLVGGKPSEQAEPFIQFHTRIN